MCLVKEEHELWLVLVPHLGTAANSPSIGAFYQRFAYATMDTPETRELLFDYFVDKIFVGATTLTIASWFFNGGAEITHEDLAEAKKTGEVSEFDTSPRGGDGGN